ncbi:MAG TPA: acyltransferase [Steroidobacteraceae bacterium]|nr:acyltransferase [Steroidobacteraceae bacterium]
MARDHFTTGSIVTEMVRAPDIRDVLPAQSASPAASVTAAKSGFNFYINGFRGLCVLLVFAYHVINSGLIPVSATPAPGKDAFLFFASSWRYGVELFFMISGFVIINSLRRHKTIAAFLKDRCIRIFPVWVPVHLCIFSLGVALGWKYFASTTLTDKFSVFISNLLLLPPLVPIPVLHPASWSLTYEWLFYLLAAASYALLVRKVNATMKASIMLPASMIVMAVIIVGLLMLLPRALFFIPGVIVALNWQSIKESRWLQSPLLQYPLISLLLFLLAWRAVNLDEARPTTTAIAHVLSWPGLAWATLAFLSGLHLFICVCNGIGMARGLKQASMQLLGNISYSFYLWHPIVMFAVKKPVTNWLVPHAGWFVSAIVFAVASFTLAVLISTASYRWIEQRLAKQLKGWLSVDHSARSETALPATPASSSSSISPAMVVGQEGRI